MRSLMMASAAFIFTAGIACAQTSTPAPEGAPTAPQVTQPGESPGKTAPAPSPSGSGMEPMQQNSAASASSPAPTGAVNAPQVTQPGQSPGNMAPPKQSSETMGPPSTGSSSTATPPTRHVSQGMAMTMPQNAGPQTYLRIASHAISHGNKAEADEALSRAETRLLTRAVPAGDTSADGSPAITSIENARHALASGDTASASQDVHRAIQQASSLDGATNASFNSGAPQ